MKNKIKNVIIVIIFSLIFTICLIMILDRKNVTIDENLIKIENENVVNNTSNNKTTNSNTVKEENTTKNENAVSENTTSNIIGKEETNSEKEEDSSQTKEEKAISLVKKEWGSEDDSVYFNIANKNGNKYTISVNSSETTEAIAWYDVDLDTEKVTSN